MNFGYIHLPREFCFLLKSNMQTSGKGHQYLKKDFWSRPSFQGVLKHACHDMGSAVSFERVINSFGWLGLRDRLAACYLHHQQFGRFPNAPTLHDVEELLSFEKNCSISSLDGHSRSFLLAFYLKMGLFYLKRHYPNEKFSNDWDTVEICELLKHNKVKVERIDWLFLSLLHLKNNLGIEKLKSEISGTGGHNTLINSMGQEDRYNYTKTLMEYGASIGDKDVFINHEV